MTTFAELLTSRASKWAVYAQIEGVGPHLSSANHTLAGDDARTRFCIKAPAYSASEPAGLWRADLFGFPDILSERADLEGGVTEYGAAAVAILDSDNWLTSQLRLESPPITTLTADISSTGTSLAIGAGSGMSATSVLWIDGEAMAVRVAPGATSVTVERGYLGTKARAHTDGAEVYLTMPFLRGRRLEIYVAPLDATSSTEATLVGSYAVDRCEWREDLNVLVFNSRSNIQAIDTTVPSQPRSVEVVSLREEAIENRGGWVELTPSASPGNGIDTFRLWTGTEASLNIFYLKNGDEVMGVEATSVIQRSVLTGRRGLAGTTLEELRVGQILPQVFVAEPTANSFRFSPGGTPSASRSSGTWTKTDHWVDLCLILLLSSAHPDDGLELTNYVASRGNWSVLPPGYGAGVLATDIDWDSWLDAKQRTPQLRFPNFVLGGEAKPVGQILTEEFLRPVGAYLTATSGLIRLVLPASPLAGSAATTVGADEILRRGDEQVPDVDLQLDLASSTAEVRFEVGPKKIPVSARTIRSGEDAKSEVISVPGAGHDDGPIWGLEAESRLAKSFRPAVNGRLALDYSVWNVGVGDIEAVTLPEAPDMRAGARGWTAMQCEVRERSINMDLNRGVWIEHHIRAYGQAARVGRRSASAYIDSVSGSTATVVTNLYTRPDAVGLPTTDAAAFQVDDVVRLINLDGTEADAGTQAVVSVSGDDVELDGDFSGSLAQDLVLVFANADEVTSDQIDNYAFRANEDTITVDGGEPYVYGER